MKKGLLILGCLSLLAASAACISSETASKQSTTFPPQNTIFSQQSSSKSNGISNQDNNGNTQSLEDWIAQNRSDSADAPQYISGSIKLDSGMLDFHFEPSYRQMYYTIGGFYFDLVDRDACVAWVDELEKSKNVEIEDTEMLLVAFIKHFRIPKEKFLEAAEKERKFYIEGERDLTSEDNEIPNADVLYTFDNEIINEYYRRQK